MSIAITAPLKFDFQDIVCVAIMLRFIQFSEARFFVEPKDGEDSEIYFCNQGKEWLAEIQVKGAVGNVTLADVAICLAHTPARTAENTLLERLLASSNRLAVLVMSGRCDDSCAPYVVDMRWDGVPHREDHISRKQTTALLRAFSVADLPGDPKGALRARRQSHNNDFVKSADLKAVRAALSRLIILERLDEATLESFCGNELRRNYRIPEDRIDDVIRQLRSVVKIAKTQELDAYPLVRNELSRLARPSIRPLNYVARGIECVFIDELSQNGVLLLTGTPRVGKSWMARNIAAELETRGYEIRTFSDVEQAERFLSETIETPRLAILDDPLGGTHPLHEPHRAFLSLKTLIFQLSPSRKLIVAQSSDQLLATARANDVTSISTAGHKWHEINYLPSAFLTSVWQLLASKFNVPDSFQNFVLSALSGGQLHLEPGCLEYLAANYSHLQTSLDLDQVVRTARQDASDLGSALEEGGFGPLLLTLALTTGMQDHIEFRSLAYASGAGGGSLPSQCKTLGRTITFGGPPLPESPGPVYDDDPELTGEQMEKLAQLERRSFIMISGGNVGFVHPFYQAAAESLLLCQTYMLATKISDIIQRGLFCLSPLTSRATAKNLDWVFERLASQVDAQSSLIEHAVEGLKSYFPATRDVCFQFLVRRLAFLPPKLRHNLPSWISMVTFIQFEDLHWSNGQAHLPFSDTISGFDALKQQFESVSREDVVTELALLDDSSGGYISPERVANVLKHCSFNQTSLTIAAIGRLLSYDEAVLRAKAIQIWLETDRDGDDIVLRRIFNDNHPSCALWALRGAIEGWSKYNKFRAEKILSGLITMAEHPACAAAMLDQLVVFDRVEETGKNPPWPIFEAVLPVVMGAIPYNAAFIDARLFNVTREAVDILPALSIVAICDGWIGWLERNSQEGRLPSEFSLGVAEILVKATRSEPNLREGRIDRLLKFPGTGSLITFVADLIDAWDDLTDAERASLIHRFYEDRPDNLWVQAVALTRSVTPRTVQSALLGMELEFEDGPDVLLARVPQNLLNAAIHVYTGHPQPLWWLGTHHSGKAVWEPVVERIVRMPEHPLFELAWNHIALAGKGVRMAQVILDVGGAHADHMLDIMIRHKVSWTGHFMPEAWAALLGLAVDEDTRSRWLDRMADHISAILDDISDLNLWFSERHDLEAMLSRLNSDYRLLEIVNSMQDLLNEFEIDRIKSEEVQPYFLLLKTLLENEPPRLFGTCDRILKIFEKNKISALDIYEALQLRRTIILDERKTIQESLKVADPILMGWIAP